MQMISERERGVSNSASGGGDGQNKASPAANKEQLKRLVDNIPTKKYVA